MENKFAASLLPIDRFFGNRLLFLGHHLRRLRGVQLVRALRHGRLGAEGHHVPGRRHLPRPGRLLLLPQRLPLLLRLRAPRSGGSDFVVGSGKSLLRTSKRHAVEN